MVPEKPVYPVRYSVDYPERLSRVSTAFRLFLAIPIFFVLAAAEHYAIRGSRGAVIFTSGGLLVLAPLLLILFRQKYPRWWFDWNLELSRFSARISAYVGLLTDQYPSTDEEQSVHLDIDYPDTKNELNRWLPLVKWLLAIPHYLVLIVLAFLSAFALLAAWFAILLTGRYPRGLFDFIVGVQRWALRVSGYALLLVTDRYPPFSMNP